jgi:hypothetical protein
VQVSTRRDAIVPIGISLVLLIFWLVMAYRAFTRGDMLLAGVFLLVGIALTAYRLRVRPASKA